MPIFTATGGVHTGGSAKFTVSYITQSSGGAHAGGVAKLTVNYVSGASSGGAETGGTATAHPALRWVGGGGGVVASGSPSYRATYTYVCTNRDRVFVFGEAGADVSNHRHDATGGVRIGGNTPTLFCLPAPERCDPIYRKGVMVPAVTVCRQNLYPPRCST